MNSNRFIWIKILAYENGSIIRPGFQGLAINGEILNTITFDKNNHNTVLSLVSHLANAF
jgi:hypothetical protein